jgi:hypothetical protein
MIQETVLGSKPGCWLASVSGIMSSVVPMTVICDIFPVKFAHKTDRLRRQVVSCSSRLDIRYASRSVNVAIECA